MSKAAKKIEPAPEPEPAGDKKDLYEIGEIPPLGHVPKQMYAWTIRRERHGEPDKAMLLETVEVPKLDSHDVLVMVMSAGVNYNGIWAALGTPVSVFDVHKSDFPRGRVRCRRRRLGGRRQGAQLANRRGGRHPLQPG
jgi:crotonyl-CoA carboxylase/reductase